MKNANVVFVCNFDALSCVEAAAQSRCSIPVNTRIARVSCLSRVHTGLILQAFELGAAGVMLFGCEGARCHFGVGQEQAEANVRRAQRLMKLLGLDVSRLVLARLPHGDGAGFAKTVTNFSVENDSVKAVQRKVGQP